MNRRNILTLFLSIPFLKKASARSIKAKRKNEVQIKGALYTIGETLIGFSDERHQSVVTKLDLETKNITQKTLPLKYGHFIEEISTGHLLAAGYKNKSLLIIDKKSLNLMKEITLPKGYLSLGHFCEIEGKIYITTYPDQTEKSYSVNSLLVYNISTNTFESNIELNGYFSHDIKAINSSTLAVTSLPKKQKEGFSYPRDQGNILIVDLKSKEVKKSLNIKLNGSPEHLGLGAEGVIFAGMTQYISLDDESFLREYISKNVDLNKRPLSISVVERAQKRFSLDSPILQWNFRKGNSIDRYMVKGKQKKLVSFSTDHNKEIVYATCAHSNTLIEFSSRTGEFIRSHNCIIFGISNVRGVCTLPNGTIALTGFERRFTLINPEDLTIIMSVDTPLFLSTHVTWSA